MKRTQIQIHGSQLKWLKQRAAENGVSMSQLIRDSIDLYRDQIERNRGFNHQRQIALDAVGSFSSGKPSIRPKHPTKPFGTIKPIVPSKPTKP